MTAADSTLTSLGQLARRRGRPASAVLRVTDRCNYDCVHCYQDHADRTELDLAGIEHVLDELAAFGALFLTLMGGEFFVRRDADDILRAARRRGFVIKLLTTGHHIDDARADLLASLRPIRVDLSVYGVEPDLHDGVTRQRGSWHRTLAAARRLIRRKVPVYLKSPVMAANVAQLAELPRLAEQLGAEFALDPQVTPMETGELEPTRLRASSTELRELFATPGVLDWDAAAASLPRRNVDAGETPCGVAQSTLAVGPRGDVRPCAILDIPCGNVMTQPLEQIWESSPDLQRLRAMRWDDIEDCNRCELRKYCKRCAASALHEHGRIDGPSLEACRQAVVFRDLLQERGLVPEHERALPPTWERLEAREHGRVRPPSLRVLP